MSEQKSTSSRHSVCQFLAKLGNIDFFGPNFAKNGFRVGNSENQCWNKNQHHRDAMRASLRASFYQCSVKTKNFDFFGPNLPKKEIRI